MSSRRNETGETGSSQSSTLVLGIDIGTTSISVVAIEETGQLRASTTRTHGAAVSHLPAGYAEQSPELLWQAVLAAVRQVMTEIGDGHGSGKVAAIGVTGQMHSTLLLDEAGRPCSNVITWQDKRAAIHQQDGISLIDSLLSRVHIAALYPSGCCLATGYLGTTLFALQQLEGLPKNFAKATFVADWIAGRLCEQLPVTDRSHAASSGLYDFDVDNWNPELLAAAEVDASWLPEVRDSGAVIGEVTDAVATATGLPAGTHVCNAIGDNQASVLSSLPTKNDCLLINIGTGGQIVWRTPKFERVAEMDTRYLPGVSSAGDRSQHQFMLVGAGLCGGDAFAWINRTVRQWLEAFGVERSEDEVWKQLALQIDELPTDMPLINCEPFFAGTRSDPLRRAKFSGVDTANFTPANVARSILHGIAETMYGVYSSASVRPKRLRSIVMSGNGVRQNPLLVEAVSKRFGVKASVALCAEEAATGAAMLAGVRTQVWRNLQIAQQKIHDCVPNKASFSE